MESTANEHLDHTQVSLSSSGQGQRDARVEQRGLYARSRHHRCPLLNEL